MAQLFIETLLRYRDQGRFQLLEFILMPDHFHLLVTPASEVSLEKAVQLIKGGFSFRVKRELGANLEVWQEGFTEHRVKDTADLQHHANYIRQNPVRAGLAETAGEYDHGSANGTVRIDSAPPWLKPRETEMELCSPG